MDPDASQRAALRNHLGLSNQDVKSRYSLKPSCHSYYSYYLPKYNTKSTSLSTSRSSTTSSSVCFFIERCPPSNTERCALRSCSLPFFSGRYRVAVTPAVSGFASQNADLYHVNCFEKIADLSDPVYFTCVEPFTRLTGGHQADGNYLCAGAVERLVLEWKARRMRQNPSLHTENFCFGTDISDDEVDESDDNDDDSIMDDTMDASDGEEDHDEDEENEEDDEFDDDKHTLDELRERIFNLPRPSYLPINQHLNNPLFHDLWNNAGRSSFNPHGPIPGMHQHEYFNLLTLLAPWESEGPGDGDEWNIFDTFLGKENNDDDDTKELLELSTILKKWEAWLELALIPEDSLTPKQVQEKLSIGEKGCRAIRRLAVVPMPQNLWKF